MEEGMQSNEVGWRSPSNIALIKYWGKRDFQLPRNPSLSVTLSKSFTETRLNFNPKTGSSGELLVNFMFENLKNPVFEERIKLYLQKIKQYFPFLDEYKLEIHSSNSFPHSSGIASSASAMSALALCLCSMEVELTAHISGFESFAHKATFLSRLGSGSASRSIFGGYVTWGECKQLPGSSDEFAMHAPITIHEKFKNLCDSILVVSSDAKAVSSSAGHKLMETNPYAGVRYNVAKTNMAQMLEALEYGDEEQFIKITEDEALGLHAMFLASSPGYILASYGTFEIIRAIRQFRYESGIFVCFTLDAGPNVHVLYPKYNKLQVHDLIKSQLLQYCENGLWIDDEIGTGPIQLH